MLGFKRFDHAAVTISGIELVQKMESAKKSWVRQLNSGRSG